MLNIVLILRSTIEIELQLSWQLKPQLLMQHLKLFLIRYFLQCMQDKQAFISKIYIKKTLEGTERRILLWTANIRKIFGSDSIPTFLCAISLTSIDTIIPFLQSIPCSCLYVCYSCQNNRLLPLVWNHLSNIPIYNLFLRIN